MDVSEVEKLLRAPALPPTELARQAGVSRNTLWTLRQDPSHARLATLRELALAEGFDLSIGVEPASDPDASAAVRFILGDIDDSLHVSPDVREWCDRLKRWVPSGDPLQLVAAAAVVAAPQNRHGAVFIKGRNDTERLTSAGLASGQPWALSGAAGLEYLDVHEPGLPTVAWAQDPTRFAELLGNTHERTRVAAAASVIIAPLHEQVITGATDVDGVILVTPVQLVIDCIGVGGQLADAATRVAKEW